MPETAKMVHVTELPPEMLSTIFMILAKSRDGLRDLARVSATCQLFNSCSTQKDILRIVNCQNVRLVGHCETHHHINGLLSRCVRAGNPSAECTLAIVVLKGGTWLWRMMLESELTNSSIKCATTLPLSERRDIARSLITNSIADLPYILFSLEDEPSEHESHVLLQHTRLVKLLVQKADIVDLILLRSGLEEFVDFFAGYHRCFESGIKDTINSMIFLEGMEHPTARANHPFLLELYESLKSQVGPISYRNLLVSSLDNLFQQ